MQDGKSITRSFVSNIGLLLILNLIIKPLYIFGIERGFSNAAGDQYGIYFELFTFCFLFQIISDLGLQNFNNRFVSTQQKTFEKYFPEIFSIKILLSGLFLAITFAFGYLFGYFQKAPLMFIFISGSVMLNTLQSYARTNLSGLGYYRLDSLISLLDKSIMIILGGIILYVIDFARPLDITWLAFCQLLAYTVTVVFIFILTFNKTGIFKLTFQKKYFAFFLKKIIPFSLVIALSAIFIRIDTLMIGKLVVENVENQLTIYGNSYRQLDALNMVGFLFSGLLLPMFSQLLAQKKEIIHLAKLSLGLLSVITISVAFPMCIWGEQVMDLLYIQANQEWGHVFSVLVLSFIPMSLNFIFGNILIANNNLKEINILYLSGVVGNIILNYYAIIHFQSYGAAVTTLFTQTIIVIGLYFICVKKRLLPGINKLIFKIISLCLLSWGISFYAYSWSKSLFVMLLAGSIIFAISLIIGLIRPKEILQMMRENSPL